MNIYQSIIAISRELGAITKSKRAQITGGGGYAYRGIDDVMNAAGPLFAKHGVFIAMSVGNITRTERATRNGAALIVSTASITYRFSAEDGSYIEQTVVGEGMDSGDKGINKCMANALKYAILHMFLVPTEDMVEPENENYEIQGSGLPPDATVLDGVQNEIHESTYKWLISDWMSARQNIDMVSWAKANSSRIESLPEERKKALRRYVRENKGPRDLSKQDKDKLNNPSSDQPM